MNDSQRLPGPRCREMVDGGVMSFPCMLELGHRGPHEAVEVPASGRRREQWLEENPVEAPAVPSASASGSDDIRKMVRQIMSEYVSVSDHTPVLDASAINSYSDRERTVVDGLRGKGVDELPAAVSSWAIGVLSMTSLAALWMMAEKHFDEGATEVIVTKELLEKIVPPSMRPTTKGE